MKIEEKTAIQPGGRSAKRILTIPRAGDEWTWKFPGKPRRTKIISCVVFTCFGSGRVFPVVWTKHAPKGRGFKIRVKWLIKNGHRLSTSAEREAKMDARLAALEEKPETK